MNLDAYLPRSQAAAIAGVLPDTLAGWHTRGWITTDGQRRTLSTRPGRRRGHLTYRVGDVLDAARDTAANPRNPGRAVQVLVLG
ncbi:hypothetical protein ABZY58_11645 [Micromonospora tulbaghiae]|uniref:hypothetical protein n=1 Tax=Micromonospora tulbaghiae TaxID=479978 RepID=UPI0033AEBEDE